MNSENSDDDDIEIMVELLVYAGMRSLRGMLLAGVAIWLAATQTYVQYPTWQIGLVIFILANLNRYSWIAGLFTAWLLVLVAVPPQIVAELASAARIAGH